MSTLLCLMTAAVALACSAPSNPPQGSGQPASPKPTVDLRVRVNGQIVDEKQVVPLKLGGSVTLRVEAIGANGTVTDVTRDPKTSYFSVTPWILSVTSTGVVTATGGPAQPLLPTNDRVQGAIAIGYGVVGDRDIGAASVLFDVSMPPEAAREGALQITAPKSALGVGETVQVTVSQRLSSGVRDLTAPESGTTYFSTDTFMLAVEPDGKVTCVGTRGRPEERATIGVRNGGLSGSISFRLVPDGPGPQLQVTADKITLREGERTQLHVSQPLPQGGRRDVTNASSGTRYYSFSGEEKLDPGVISVDNAGVATAMKSLGRYNWLSALILVRNEGAVGWIELRVSRTGAE